MRAYLKITTRTGQTLFDSDEGHTKPLWVIERDMLDKHGNAIFVFRAPPSEAVSKGPARRAPQSRKFSMAD